MADEKKTRISVNIYGKTYPIVGSEKSGHVQQVASIVDEKMRQLRDRNPALDTASVAILTAVNMTNDYIKLQQDYEQLEEQLKKEKD